MGNYFAKGLAEGNQYGTSQKISDTVQLFLALSPNSELRLRGRWNLHPGPSGLPSLSCTQTLKQYARPIRLWWEFCQKKETSPFEPLSSLLLEFLSLILEGVNAYCTLNSY